MYRLYEENDFDFSICRGTPTIYISDIDETYLKTDFRTIRGLITTTFQYAIDRIVYPGMSEFYRTIKKDGDSALFFLSSSPHQMKELFRRKLLLEEVPYDGMVLRDLVHLLATGGTKEMRNPFGFKLFATLKLAASFPDGSRIVLIGDDTESDAGVYEAFKRITDGSLGGGELSKILAGREIQDKNIAAIIATIGAAAGQGLEVTRIFIRDTGRGCDTSGVVLFRHPGEMLDILIGDGVL